MRSPSLVPIVVLIMCGCNTVVTGRSDIVHMATVPGQPKHSDAVIDGASEILGLELSYDPREFGAGAVSAFADETPHERCSGGAALPSQCYPLIWSTDNSLSFAHELGHALNLTHSDDPENLMHPRATKDGVTEEQVDIMRWSAWWIDRC